MLSVLSRFQRGFLIGSDGYEPFEQMIGHLLELTDSEYGFIADVLYDEAGQPYLRMHGLSNIGWCDETRAAYERLRSGRFEFRNLDTLFGEVVRTARPVISNDPSGDPRSGGLPPGHPLLCSFLGLPLFHAGQSIGVVGLANAPQGYTENLVGELEPMLATCGNMIVALRLEAERNQAQLALQESEQHFRTLANSASALIRTSGTGMSGTYFNEPWLRFTGRTLGQELGDGWMQGVHPDDARRCAGIYASAFARREPFRMEYRLRHADGGYRWISDEGSPVCDSAGAFSGYIGHCIDVTDRKRIEMALDALAARYALLSGVAFYEAVSRHLAEALELDIAFVGQIRPGAEVVDVRGGWQDGAAMLPISYPLAGTPCAEVLGRQPCIHPRNVAQRFSSDRMLAELGIEAYCGTPLVDKEGRSIGLIAGLKRTPIGDEQAVQSLMDIFDDRVSAELQRERSEMALNRRIMFERLVSQIAAELIPASPEELDPLIDRALSLIGSFAEADRAYVFQVSDDGLYVSNTHEWCAPGIQSQKDSLQGIPFDDQMLFCRTIRRLEVVDFPSVAGLPAEAVLDRELLGAQSIQSVLAVPMVAGKGVIGFIGLDAVHAPRNWSDEEKTLLALTGNAFTGVLERKRADDTLRASEARYRSVVEGVKEVIFQIDRQRRWVFLNRAWLDITGHPVERALGCPCSDYVHPEDRAQHLEMFDALHRREADSLTQAVRYQRIGGSFRWVEVNARAVTDAAGAVIGFSGTLNDITIQKEHEAQLEYIAHYDALTGLPNRVLLQDRLQRSMAQSRRRGTRLAVAYIDLDGFKAVNDRHGHQAGDQLLTTVAARMKAVLREGDSISRLGGDEFVAVLIDLEDTDSCLLLVQRLLSAVAQSVRVAGHDLNVSASIGLTLYPQGEEVDADQLLRQADLAMYEAKLAGKNRHHIFDTAHDRSQRSRHESLGRIRQALDQGEFALFYQPKVNMRTGVLVGAEALIRWNHPQQGLLEPAAFLPTVADHPLAVDLGNWVIGQALAQIVRWKAQGIDVPVSVNISARHLHSPDFMLMLQSALAAHPHLSPGSLELEVLETSALESMTQVTRIVEACAAIGVSFALDDFGTGYSSLAYLKRLPAARLKIDQLFVRNMLDDPEDLAILEAVLGLARAFRREVTAEGVESEAHGRLLLQLGCDVAQGFGIALPMPATELVRWAFSWSPPASWRRQRVLAREDMALLYSEVEHRALLRQLVTAVASGMPFDGAGAPHDCSLHRWFDAAGDGARADTAVGLLRQHHARFHEGVDAVRRCSGPAEPDAAALLDELRSRLDDLLLHSQLMRERG
ncbi:diguanylate cyclase [Thauera sinica]|nr:diguanylate cyclase [Thauera sp. K11]